MGQVAQGDKKLSLAIISSFVILGLQYFILVSFDLFGTETINYVKLISKILVAIVFVYAFPVMWKRNKLFFISTYFFSAFIFLLHYLIFPGNRVFMGDILFLFFFTCLPSFVYARSIYNWETLKIIMLKASYLILFFGVAISLQVFLGLATVGAYSMSLSYYMLLPAIIFLNELFKKFTIKNIIYAIISIIIVLALGARGPLLCIVLFVLFRLKPGQKFNYKQILIYFLMISLCVIVVLHFNDMLELIQNVLLHFGVSSRTIMLVLNRSFFQSSGRNVLYRAVIKELFKKPFIGLGLAGDRVVSGGYVHNIFLEVMADFGMVFGGIISIIIILLIVRTLIIKKSKQYEMLVIWISLGFIPLLVSGSYLIDMKFWILLGLILRSFALSKGKNEI